MSTAARLPVVPTVTVLAVMKARLAGAVKGHALLKKKADALSMRCVVWEGGRGTGGPQERAGKRHQTRDGGRPAGVWRRASASPRLPPAWLAHARHGRCRAVWRGNEGGSARHDARTTRRHSFPDLDLFFFFVPSTLSFRQILKRILQSKLRVGTSMRTASFALTEAK